MNISKVPPSPISLQPSQDPADLSDSRQFWINSYVNVIIKIINETCNEPIDQYKIRLTVWYGYNKLRMEDAKVTQFVATNLYKIARSIQKETKGYPTQFSLKYLDVACLLGHTEATYELGRGYLFGNNMPKNVKAAFQLLSFASSKDHRPAKFLLAKCYLNGLGTTKNLKKAMEMFESEDCIHEPEAQYKLGTAYFYGIGVEKDKDKACEFALKAYNQCFWLAASLLGHFFFEGTSSTEQNYEMSFVFFLTSAAKGHFASIFHVGLAYEFGYGIDQDRKYARRIYQYLLEQKKDNKISEAFEKDIDQEILEQAEKGVVRLAYVEYENDLEGLTLFEMEPPASFRDINKCVLQPSFFVLDEFKKLINNKPNSNKGKKG